MCLDLNESSAKDKRNFRRRKNPIKAYKILEIEDNLCLSPYQNTVFLEKMTSNREEENPCKLTNKEIKDREVHKGLHFYMNIEDAQNKKDKLNLVDFIRNYYCVYEVEIQPKDVVAVGTFDSKLSIVANKTKIIKRINK